MAYNLYRFGLTFVSNKNEFDEKFRNFEKVDSIFGQNKKELLSLVVMLYYGTYLIIAFLLFIFGSLFTWGAHRVSILRYFLCLKRESSVECEIGNCGPRRICHDPKEDVLKKSHINSINNRQAYMKALVYLCIPCFVKDWPVLD